MTQVVKDTCDSYRTGKKLASWRIIVKTQITILTTGGTIEKTYDEVNGTLDNRGTVIKQKIERQLRLPYLDLKIIPILNKDSLEMNDLDRELIARYIREEFCNNSPIVILHGTDTMDQSIQFCHDNMDEIPVPVVFTGAMKPMGFIDSDAVQNVTEAIFAAQNLNSGIYLTFHSKVYSPGKFRKNKQLKRFESI